MPLKQRNQTKPKFSICLMFYQFVTIKNKNLNHLRYVIKHKIYIVYRENAWACSHKNASNLGQK